MNETNWVSERANSTVTESDRRALEKAHRYEERLEKKGYRWITVNSRMKVFAECDKEGNLTKLGKQQVERMKANFNVK